MYFLGLDLGQKRDHSAVVVVERIDHRRAFQGSAFEKLRVRYVERMPLGMPYPKIVDRVRAIVQSEELREAIARWRWMPRVWVRRWSICCGRRGWVAI